MRILIIEDDKQLTAAWSRLLRRKGHTVKAISSAENALAALDPVRWQRAPYQAVLIDLKLPDGDGSSLLSRCAALRPRPNVAVISGWLDARRTVDLWQQCTITVPKPLDANTLYDLIERMEQNDDPSSATSEFARHYRLSPRETELLMLAARGLDNGQAADELGCAAGTVQSFWRRIFQKTGCRSQRRVLAAVLRHRDPSSPEDA